MKKIIFIGLGLLVFIGIGYFGYQYYKDSMKYYNNNLSIKENYEELRVNVLEYNKIREEYIGLMNNFYYDKFRDNYNNYVDLVNRYSNNIDKIDKIKDNLLEECSMNKLDDDSIKICKGYTYSYERLVNIYIDDINNLNKKIDSYNNDNENKLDNIKIKFSQYIDINNDNKFEGISE